MTEDTSTPPDFEEKWAEWESNLLDPPAPDRAPTVPRPWPVAVWARGVWATVCARLVALLARPRGGHFRARAGVPRLHVAALVVVVAAVTADVVVWARVG